MKIKKHSAFSTQHSVLRLRRFARNDGVLYRRGVILIGVMWLLVLLTVMVTLLAKEADMDRRMSQSVAEQVRADWAAHAGLERAIALLSEDSTGMDSLADLWHDNGLDCNDIALTRCRFTIRIEDASGKLNINTATKEQLLVLPEMTEAMAEAILDWRDEDNTPRASSVEGGYYHGLAPGYEIRNGPFQTVWELLLVRDVTRGLLYGEDTNLNGKLDPQEDDGEATPPFDNGDGRLDRGWLPHLTCYSYHENKDGQGNDRTNINKADENTLVADLKIKKAHAKWIVDNRKNEYKSIVDLINDKSPKEPQEGDSDSAWPLDKKTFANIVDQITVKEDERITGLVNINTASETVLASVLDGDWKLANNLVKLRDSSGFGLASLGELVGQSSISLDQLKKITDKLTTRSNVFGVTCEAESTKTGAVYRSEAVIDRGGRGETVLYRYQGAGT
jgi:type II secretory pathway component PulK